MNKDNLHPMFEGILNNTFSLRPESGKSMNPAVTKAAQAIWNNADAFDLPTQEGVPVLAEIIERETKYSRLVEAATKVLASEFSSNHREWREVIAQLRSVLDEIKEG